MMLQQSPSSPLTRDGHICPSSPVRVKRINVLPWSESIAEAVISTVSTINTITHKGMMRYSPLLLFGWAFTRQSTYVLRVLMLYNSPVDSLGACHSVM